MTNTLSAITYILFFLALDVNEPTKQSNPVNENVFYNERGDIFTIECDLRCSNENCSGNQSLNPNAKNQQQLFAGAGQMEEDVNRHILKDSPHGEQVNE